MWTDAHLRSLRRRYDAFTYTQSVIIHAFPAMVSLFTLPLAARFLGQSWSNPEADLQETSLRDTVLPSLENVIIMPSA